jgi:hypothetical protein
VYIYEKVLNKVEFNFHFTYFTRFFNTKKIPVIHIIFMQKWNLFQRPFSVVGVICVFSCFKFNFKESCRSENDDNEYHVSEYIKMSSIYTFCMFWIQLKMIFLDEMYFRHISLHKHPEFVEEKYKPFNRCLSYSTVPDFHCISERAS